MKALPYLMIVTVAIALFAVASFLARPFVPALRSA
jgi:hypothetical protein